MSDLLSARQLTGLTGEEQPLTPADIVAFIERGHAPWEANRVLRGQHHDTTGRGGGAGYLGMSWTWDRRGIHARIVGPPARGGLIPRAEVERIIIERGKAAPETVRALQDAMAAYHEVVRRAPTAPPGQVAPPVPEADLDERHRQDRAARDAWHAIMAATPPEQLDLF